ncbi:hypothetical protein Vretifemale_2807, partial [Volvox reticuliferus]
VWMDDPEAGVSVRDANGKWILYGFAVDQFKTLELEILRVASYHLEVYAAQVHAGSSNSIGRRQAPRRPPWIPFRWSTSSQFSRTFGNAKRSIAPPGIRPCWRTITPTVTPPAGACPTFGVDVAPK